MEKLPPDIEKNIRYLTNIQASKANPLNSSEGVMGTINIIGLLLCMGFLALGAIGFFSDETAGSPPIATPNQAAPQIEKPFSIPDLPPLIPGYDENINGDGLPSGDGVDRGDYE